MTDIERLIKAIEGMTVELKELKEQLSKPITIYPVDGIAHAKTYYANWQALAKGQ